MRKSVHSLKKQDPARLRARAEEWQLAAGQIAPCPEWVPEEGQKKYAEITGDADYMKQLASRDCDQLVLYCSMWAKFVDSMKGLREMKATELQMMQSAAMQLGLSPNSRSRLKQPGGGAPVENRWALLSGGKSA